MKLNIQYTNIAKKFLQQYKNPQLKKILETAMPNQKPNFYFNVKAEILRLSKECNRIIDLRDKIKEEQIHEISTGSLTHYLNDTGLEEFERVSKIYENRFTFGVYEAVYEKVKEVQNKELEAYQQEFEESQQEKRVLDYINFNEFNIRNEERMFFAVEVKIYEKVEETLKEDIKRIKGFYNRNEFLDHDTGLTIDFSLSGLNIKISDKISYDVGKQIIVRVTGIEKEVVFNTPYIEYEVLKVTHKGKFNYIALKKIDNELNKEVETYIQNIINGYKKKYKVDLSHVIKSVRSKGYEQYYMSKYNDLSFLFNKQKQFLIPKYEYVSDKDDNIFKNLKSGSNLARTMLHSKMHECMKDENKGSFYFMFFSFIRDNKKLYYSMSTNDLSSKNAINFISYGIKQKTLKLLKSDYTKIDPLKDAFVKSSLPIHVLKNISPDSLELSPKVKEMIKDVEYIINFNDITPLLDHDFYFKLPLNAELVKDLDFCLVKNYAIDPIMSIQADKQDFRFEDRFSYNTNLTITYKGKEYKGYTTDISIKGLRIKLDERIFFERNLKVKITFDDFTNQVQHSLDNVDYRVVNSKERILFCNASGNLQNHEGIAFCKKFIYKNYSKMKTTGNSNEILGLTESIKNIVSKNYSNLPTFFEFKNKQVQPFMLAGYDAFCFDFDLYNYLGVNHYNIEKLLKPIFFNQNFLEKTLLGFSQLNDEHKFARNNYYVNVKVKKGKPFYKFLFEEQVGSLKDKKNFLEPTDGSRTFVFQLKISKKNRIFNKYFKHELMYIESYYVHKAEEILQEFKKVNGIIEFSDITDFVKAETNKLLSDLSNS